MLKVYFTAATSSNGELHDNYAEIILQIEKAQSKVVSGRQIINKNLLEQDKLLSKDQIFKREKINIDWSDLIVAEVTKPSTGVGGEIVYALMKGKPVLALIYKENKDKLSPMLAGNPSDNLFLEHYDFDNLHLILKNFLFHIHQLKNKKGKLIIIEGGDGSGKATQAKLLVDFLKSQKIKVKYLDFPRYYTSFHGKTVARFLRGEFGALDRVSPYLISLAYALDRVSVKEEMDEFLSQGGIIVANRYATSNMAHQSARIKNDQEKKSFIDWISELEYKIHKIPREDLVFYLYVPWRIGMDLTTKKDGRDYLKGKKLDISESDDSHRIEAEKMYLQLAKEYKHWVKINCAENNKILPPKIILNKIIDVLKSKLK